jgi:UDP-N-acetylglucosamine---dolichyl-phosphate N-acetylglucosaminyltransferase
MWLGHKNMNQKKVFIIIPGLNEEKHIYDVVSRTKKQGFANVVFVDDGSRDKSGLLAKKAGAIVLRHIVNMGKGAAAKTGCDYALKNGAEIVVLIDADGQHKPEDIKKFLKKIENNDIVFGYRTLNGKMPFLMRLGNWGISMASRIINGVELKDTQSGFRCMTAATYRKVRWTSNDYGMESEMIANVARKKLKYAQIPIATIYHDNFKGTTVMDGIKIFIRIVKFRIRRD